MFQSRKNNRASRLQRHVSPACSCRSNCQHATGRTFSALGQTESPVTKNKPHRIDETKNWRRQFELTKRVASIDTYLRQKRLRLLRSTRACFSPFERVQWRGYSTSSSLAGGSPRPYQARGHAAFARQDTPYVPTASIACETTASTASTQKTYTPHQDT